jgi:hypothetical protein
LRGKRLIVYLAAAMVLILSAGCGWSSGPPFAGDYEDFDPETYDPTESTPITAVQAWFASMEYKRAPNEAGVMVPSKELGRDFDLWLMVVNPELLLDPSGQFIGMEQVDALRELWNSDEWYVEFLEIKMEEDEESSNAREAKVLLVDGGIRYIGDDFFDSPEYRQDSFGDKKGEILLRYYEGSANDPLLNIAGLEDVAGKGRWVVVGGLDLSEDWGWGEQP